MNIERSCCSLSRHFVGSVQMLEVHPLRAAWRHRLFDETVSRLINTLVYRAGRTAKEDINKIQRLIIKHTEYCQNENWLVIYLKCTRKTLISRRSVGCIR